MSKEASDNWTNFSKAVTRFTTELENRLGEKLSGVAESLTHLSGALTKVIETLLNWPIVKTVLDKIASWLDTFASFLEKDSTIKALEAFGKFFSETLKLEFLLFTGQFKAFVEEIQSLIPSIQNLVSGIWDWIKGKVPSIQAPSMDTDPVTGLPYPIRPGGSNWTPGQGGTNFGGIGGNVYAYAGGGRRTGTSLASFGGNANSVASFLGGGRSSFASIGGSGTGGTRIVGGGGGGGGTRLLASASPGGGGFSFAGAPGGGRGDRTTFASATERVVPRGDSLGFASAMQLAAINNFGGGGRRGVRGAQDIDNWQTNRTASLVLRDVPSANMYVTGAGMSA
jgi:hypothetical protein